MSNYNESVIPLNKSTLTPSGVRAFIFQVLLIAAAFILPALAHLSGAPIRFLLPMHWPIILAGLVYGWRAGVLTGLLAPIVSYFLSGFPLPIILPFITFELLTYGLVTGLLRELLHLNPFISVAIALLLGRIVFVVSVLFGNTLTINYLGYFKVALLPGIIAALFQIALLPFLAKWWIRHEQQLLKE